MTMQQRIFRGGEPTKLDVDRLMAEVVSDPGTSVSYERIEQIIGKGRETSRFRTVTSAWRRRLFREHLLQTVARGGAIWFLTPDQAHDHGKSAFLGCRKAIARTAAKVSVIDPGKLSPDRQPVHQRMVQQFGALREQARVGALIIAGPQPISSLVTRIADPATVS